MSALPDPASIASGESGHVAGVRQITVRRARDLAHDARARLLGVGRALDGAALRMPVRRVRVLSVYRPDSELMVGAARELLASRHRVSLALGSTGSARGDVQEHTIAVGMEGGKFQNLNRLISVLDAAGDAPPPDWVLVVDDDVRLPRHFLDRFLALCELFELDLAQPAQTLRSHAAWRVTRRRRRPLLRRTRFVEIGPVTAFGGRAAEALIPFPSLRYGWGLELRWAALAEERGWRLGIADAVPVRHELHPVATTYGHAAALAEAQEFLSERSYLPSSEVGRTLAAYERLPW